MLDELDYLHDPHSNSIGALLAHIAAAEVGYQAATFDARDLTAEERQQWGAAIELGERARAGDQRTRTGLVTWAGWSRCVRRHLPNSAGAMTNGSK